MLTFKFTSYFIISIIIEADKIDIASSSVLIFSLLLPSNPKAVDVLTSWVVYEIR